MRLGQLGSVEGQVEMNDDRSAEHILWLSGERWDQDGGTHRAMATAMSAYSRILWVDPPKSPVHQNRKNNNVRPLITEVAEQIMCLRPVVLPGFSRPGVRVSTPVLMRAQIRWAIRKLGFQPSAVVMLYLGGLLGGWGSGVTNVMYGTDDYVAGAELMRTSARNLRHRERKDLARADVVVAVSSELARRWTDVGPSPVVIPNGCWPFSGGMDSMPAKEVNLPSPVVGLIGRLSNRIDLDVLEAIADSGQSLLLMGPQEPSLDPKRFRDLTNRPSVRYTGPVPSDEVPAYLAAIDVGITPYRDSAFNRASFPLKTLEYLSVGLPVVTSDLPAMRWLRADLEEVETEDLADQILVLAKNSQDYLTAIKMMATSSPGLASRRIAFARRHSWTHRAEQFAAVIGSRTN
jgi:teichuronic acid biosynthesis glycosyltransferase TuaH